ncbi:WAT1-related protein At2g39510-like [Rutidosis leptorrhynchoides]|uniref:WAT1-related protein At2g39510-like n=1 Tax=Rutidosis leptorrhynchoides TaxID=125765 RepID=UPI003A99890E
MTISIFIKIMVLGLLEPVIYQNLYYSGMNLTTVTFATAMCNIVPAITFVMAWILRLEKVKMESLHSQGKIIGTLVTVGGAMIMTLITGPVIQFPWTYQHTIHQQSSVNTKSSHDQIKGSLMITAGCFSWASFVIVQGTNEGLHQGYCVVPSAKRFLLTYIVIFKWNVLIFTGNKSSRNELLRSLIRARISGSWIDPYWFNGSNGSS